MMHTDTGTQGAKRQTWYKVSPRSLLKELCDSNKGADEGALQKLFVERVKDDLGVDDLGEYMPAIIEYWFARNFRSLVTNEPRKAGASQPSAETVRATEALKEKLNAHIQLEVQRILLDTVILPNGKTLRDATGQDCAIAGGWLRTIAAKIKPDQIVGDVFSEDEIQKLYQHRLPKK